MGIFDRPVRRDYSTTPEQTLRENFIAKTASKELDLIAYDWRIRMNNVIPILQQEFRESFQEIEDMPDVDEEYQDIVRKKVRAYVEEASTPPAQP